eukprot:6111823-Amphidinium_carterae.2
MQLAQLMSQMQQMFPVPNQTMANVTEVDARTKQNVVYPTRTPSQSECVAIERVPWSHIQAFMKDVQWVSMSGEKNMCF